MDIKAHPHAGVAPTTYLLSGSGRHTDSLENDLVYREGQFMVFSSGRGAIHEEVSSMEIRRDGGVVHGFQIWLNLPAAHKFSTPITTLRDKADFPVIETEAYRLKVVMGEVFGQASPTELHSPAFLLPHQTARRRRDWTCPWTPHTTVSCTWSKAVWRSKGSVNWSTSRSHCTIGGGDHAQFFTKGGAEFLVLGGQPLNEPVGLIRTVRHERQQPDSTVHCGLPSRAGWAPFDRPLERKSHPCLVRWLSGRNPIA